MTDNVVRIEDIRRQVEALADRVDARADSMERDDATRYEKMAALKGKMSPTFTATQPKERQKQKQPSGFSAVKEAAEHEREKEQTLKEFAALRRQIQQSQEGGSAKDGKDSAGAEVRNGQAYYKGVVIKPGGIYAPKGFFGGVKKETSFLCVDVEWLGGRIIARGMLRQADKMNISGVDKELGERFYNVTDLVPYKTPIAKTYAKELFG